MLYYTNIISTIALTKYPLKSKFKNNLEFINEYFTSVTCYVIISFTDFSISYESKHLGGLIFIAIMGFNILSNGLIVLIFMIKNFKLLFLRYYRALRFKIINYLMKKKINEVLGGKINEKQQT